MSISTCSWWAAASPASVSHSMRRRRGLRTALVERHDFAAGTSSKSSKLVHGGLRYLQQREYGLVYEGLAERQRLRKTAPHLVRVLPFLIPIFSARRPHQSEGRQGPRLGDVDVRPHGRRAHRQAAQAAGQGCRARAHADDAGRAPCLRVPVLRRAGRRRPPHAHDRADRCGARCSSRQLRRGPFADEGRRRQGGRCDDRRRRRGDRGARPGRRERDGSVGRRAAGSRRG